MILRRKKHPEMQKGPVAFWDAVQPEASLVRGRDWYRVGIVHKEGSDSDLWKLLSILPVPPPGWKWGSQRQGKGHGTWQAPAENFGLRSQRASEGPARALVSGLSGWHCREHSSCFWLLGRSPWQPRLNRLGEACVGGGSLWRVIGGFVFFFWLCHTAYGILVSWPGVVPMLPWIGGRVLTTGCRCSVAKSCLTLCNPMDCSMPGFPVLHCLS